MRGVDARTCSVSSMIMPPDDVVISMMPEAWTTRFTKSFMSRGMTPFTATIPSL
jgi:hypothetical protein